MKIMVRQQVRSHLILLILSILSLATATRSISANTNTTHTKIKGISFKKLLSVLHTESSKEFYTKEILTDSKLWKSLTEFEWNLIHEHDDKYHPFIMCKTDDELSSQDRHVELLDLAKDEAFMQPLYVKPDETCYVLYTTYDKCKELSEKDGIKIQPMSYSMKLLSGSIDLVEQLWHEEKEKERDGDRRLKEVVELKPPSDVISTSDSDTDNTSTSSKKKDNIEKPFLTIDAAMCANNYEKISKQHEHFHHFIRKTILEYSLDISKIKKHFFWSNFNNDNDNEENNISERALFWKSLLKSKNHCGDVFNDINISFEDYIPTSKSNDGVTMPILKIIFPKANKSCIYQFLLSLSLQNFICTIQVQSNIQTYNHNVQWLIQTGVKDTTPWYDVGIDGSNQIIGISDTGIDRTHCYFVNNSTSSLTYGQVDTIDTNQRKIVQYDDFVNRDDYKYGHGTHVAGSLVGVKVNDNDVSHLQTIDPGIAPNAKVAFIDIGTNDGALILPSLSRVLETGYANVHSASWGNTYNGYGLYSMQFDNYVYYTNDELLPVVAAGNSGKDGSHSTTEPSNAKNVIAVGSAHSYGNDIQDDMKGPGYVSYFSSQGPTADGRAKPDIIAPGHYVSSAAAYGTGSGCDPNNGKSPDPNHATEGLVSFAGTSMATPMIASSSALIRQYLQEGYYPTGKQHSSDAISNPSAALIKGIIMNGAQYLFGLDKEDGGDAKDVHPYDNIQNFGRVSLVDTLYIVDKSNVQVKLWDRESIDNTYDENTYTVKIDTSGGCTNDKLSVTLSYTDPPGTSGCTYCLINDLNLVVKSKPSNEGDTKQYYPNGKSSPDNFNNIERVIVDNVKHDDTFEIIITASTLIESQSYSIVASGCFGGTGNSIDMSESVYVEEDEGGHVDWFLISIILLVIFGGCGCCYVMKRQDSIEEEIRNQGQVYVIKTTTTLPNGEVINVQEPLINGTSY